MIAFAGFLFATALTPGPLAHTAWDLSGRANQLYETAHYREAEPLYREALEAWRKEGTDGAPERALERAETTRNLGALLRATGRYREAEPLLIESLRELQTLGAGTREIERALFNLAALYRAMGNLGRAESFGVQAAAVLDRGQGITEAERDGPRLVLASIYLEQRRYEEAERLFQKLLEDGDAALAVGSYNGLSMVAMARRDYAQAEQYARRALHLGEMALPPEHSAAAAAWNNLAQACRFQGKYLDAEKGYRLAIQAWEDTLGEGHPYVALALMNLAAFYHERGREAGAEALYLRAAAILERTFGKDDPQTLAVTSELVDVLRAERRYTEGEKLGRSTLAELQKLLPAGDPRVVRAQANYARVKAAAAETSTTRCRSCKAVATR